MQLAHQSHSFDLPDDVFEPGEKKPAKKGKKAGGVKNTSGGVKREATEVCRSSNGSDELLTMARSILNRLQPKGNSRRSLQPAEGLQPWRSLQIWLNLRNS